MKRLGNQDETKGRRMEKLVSGKYFIKMFG